MILAEESPSLWLQSFWNTHLISWRKIIAGYYLENNVLEGDLCHRVNDEVWRRGILVYGNYKNDIFINFM